MSHENGPVNESMHKAPVAPHVDDTFVCDLRDLPTEALERIRAKLLAGSFGSATD